MIHFVPWKSLAGIIKQSVVVSAVIVNKSWNFEFDPSFGKTMFKYSFLFFLFRWVNVKQINKSRISEKKTFKWFKLKTNRCQSYQFGVVNNMYTNWFCGNYIEFVKNQKILPFKMVLCINNLKTFLKNIVSSFKTFVPLVINKTITHTVMINEVEDQTRAEQNRNAPKIISFKSVSAPPSRCRNINYRIRSTQKSIPTNAEN